MDRGRVGEDRGSKETDGCPLTVVVVVGGGRGGRAVVVIGRCGCGDVREWGMGLGWCRRHVIIVR
jgi:hypothetical protein